MESLSEQVTPGWDLNSDKEPAIWKSKEGIFRQEEEQVKTLIWREQAYILEQRKPVSEEHYVRQGGSNRHKDILEND